MLPPPPAKSAAAAATAGPSPNSPVVTATGASNLGHKLPTAPLPPSGTAAAATDPAMPQDLSASATKKSPHAETVIKKIDQLMSENQAIVDTLDPLWPRRYKWTKDGGGGEERGGRGGGRKYSGVGQPQSLAAANPVTTTVNNIATNAATVTTITSSTLGGGAAAVAQLPRTQLTAIAPGVVSGITIQHGANQFLSLIHI